MKTCNTHKKCCACKEWKKHTEFYKNKAKNDQLSSRCKDCFKTYSKNNWLSKRYGITTEEYDRMREEQGYRCKNRGCRKHEDKLQKGLCVDHDHDTGKVRGLLCTSCNTAEGLAYSDPQILLGLIEYLGYDLDKEVLNFKNKSWEEAEPTW